MTKDIGHQNLKYLPSFVKHNYPKTVKILSNPYLMSILEKFGRPDIFHPAINSYVSILYNRLIEEVISLYFEKETIISNTRMIEFDERGKIEFQGIKNNLKVICVDLARAGTFPTHKCFDTLNYLLRPEGIRQDHIYINRATNENGEVTGVDVAGSKIGGDKDNSIVLIPDPMGATGGSLSYVVDFYKNKIKGKAIKFVAMHLVITPEYIKRMTNDHPDVEIIAVRLDRGLSSEKILQTLPGTHWDREIGLTDKQYIVPGLGGVGEILNNSFV